MRFTVALLLVACDPASTTLSPGLYDVSDQSPELARAATGGTLAWDHSEMYSPGVALVDLDGDGVLDLAQPRNHRSDASRRSLRLWRGLGDGRFVAAPAPSWDDARLATAVVAFDFDRDGDLDLFIGVDGGPSALYRNHGAWQFTDVAPLVGAAAPGVRVFTAAAADVDGDGWLDLYLGAWNASAPEHGGNSSPNLLLLNREGVFADDTERAGVACDGLSTLGVSFADLDGDGDQDLFVANDWGRACLYENRGDGVFVDRAAEAGVIRGSWHGMGVAIGDLDGDLRPDLLVTDDQWPDDAPGYALYLNRGGMRFESAAQKLGLDGAKAAGTSWTLGWGAGLVDFDLDGALDAHVGTHAALPELLWLRRGDTFEPQKSLMARMAEVDARGTAYGDLDGDGDLDVVVARRGSGLQILRNDLEGGHFLTVAPRPLALAPGSEITITVAGRKQRGFVQAGSSYQSTNPPEVTFGLGAATTVDAVEVRFPDGSTRSLANLSADSRITVER